MTETPAYLNPALSFEARVADLVARMTLEEKCAQLTYEAPGIERLRVAPHNWWNECLHGVGRAGLATVFPQAIGLAATFDTDLMHRVATAISDEARAKHHAHAARGDFGIYKGLTFWSPNINIFRDPRWGRGHETYGECPHLTARMGVAFIRGLQGDDPRYLKLVATAKHYAVHSGPEKGRHSFDVSVSKRDLYETYLPAFQAAILEAGAFSVMGAYNRLDGEPCCASRFLLEDTLRTTWGFAGYTVSDCGAITDIHAHHKVTANPAESAALALRNGLDLCCGNDYTHLLEAVGNGLVDEATITRSCARLMLARMKLGMFDPPEQVAYTRIPYAVVDSSAHRQLALQAARQSIVLLKNAHNILPLAKTVRRIAVIGPNADAREYLLGNYHGTPSDIVTPLQGIRARVAADTTVTFVRGCTHLPTEGSWLGTTTRGFVEAVMAAEQSDLVIMCMGLTPTIEGEEGDAMNSDAGGDRTRIELPGMQEQLIKAVVATGKPVVLVLVGGSALAVPWAQENVAAILQVFYPGQAGGTALADILFGEHNPSARLPFTVYRSTSDLPAFNDYAMAHRTYRYYSGPVLYPFGFGLSYTQFRYTGLQAPATARAGMPINVSVVVQNVGNRAGDEVIQVYLQPTAPNAAGPRMQLVAFQRIALAKGESRTVGFTLPREVLTAVDDNGERRSLRGRYRIAIGGSQPDDCSQRLGAAAAVVGVVEFASAQ